jgi:hypothetical protein
VNRGRVAHRARRRDGRGARHDRAAEHPLITRGIRLWNATYDVTTDGQRFVVIEDIEPTGLVSSPIHIVQNWYDEFRDRDQK